MRELSAKEQRVKNWIAKNRGVLTRTASDFGLSLAYVQRIAYGQGCQSKGLRVEHKLRALGWPNPNQVKIG